MLGAYTAGISGAHLNPAVTLANCIYRSFPWRKLPVYVLAQLIGGLCAAAVIYGNYNSAIDVFEGGAGIRTVPDASEHATAAIFATYPASFMTTTGEFFSEFIATAILMFMIYCLQDNSNYGAGHMVPLGLFATVFGIATCFGWETSFAINPARDLGPRLLTSMVGYGSAVYTTANHYFWIPLVAPTLGAVFGGFLYDTLLFTGQSPINTPYWGLYRFVPGMRRKYDGVVFDSIGWSKTGRILITARVESDTKYQSLQSAGVFDSTESLDINSYGRSKRDQTTSHSFSGLGNPEATDLLDEITSAAMVRPGVAMRIVARGL
nr:aquaporin-3 [Quercus suber]